MAVEYSAGSVVVVVLVVVVVVFVVVVLLLLVFPFGLTTKNTEFLMRCH